MFLVLPSFETPVFCFWRRPSLFKDGLKRLRFECGAKSSPKVFKKLAYKKVLRQMVWLVAFALKKQRTLSPHDDIRCRIEWGTQISNKSVATSGSRHRIVQVLHNKEPGGRF